MDIILCPFLSAETFEPTIVYLYMTLHGMNEPMGAITELHTYMGVVGRGEKQWQKKGVLRNEEHLQIQHHGDEKGSLVKTSRHLFVDISWCFPISYVASFGYYPSQRIRKEDNEYICYGRSVSLI